MYLDTKIVAANVCGCDCYVPLQWHYFNISLQLSNVIHRVGYNTLIYVEGLHISGPVQAAVIIDRDIPFPHVSQVTATFCRKWVYTLICCSWLMSANYY